MYNFFFRERSSGGGGAESGSGVLGDDLGAKAGERNQAALDQIYAVPVVTPPAAVRPDPDLYVRRLLRQFRDEGGTLARVSGDVENYRQLLGGASLDFATATSASYDATSVLALMKVAEEACVALVAPIRWKHPGWSTILPKGVADRRGNLEFLYQRLTGVRVSQIPAQALQRLELMTIPVDGSLKEESYVAPCAAIIVDAQSMLL